MKLPESAPALPVRPKCSPPSKARRQPQATPELRAAARAVYLGLPAEDRQRLAAASEAAGRSLAELVLADPKLRLEAVRQARPAASPPASPTMPKGWAEAVAKEAAAEFDQELVRAFGLTWAQLAALPVQEPLRRRRLLTFGQVVAEAGHCSCLTKRQALLEKLAATAADAVLVATTEGERRDTAEELAATRARLSLALEGFDLVQAELARLGAPPLEADWPPPEGEADHALLLAFARRCLVQSAAAGEVAP